MSLDLGELAGTLRLDTDPFFLSIERATLKATAFAARTKEKLGDLKADIYVDMHSDTAQARIKDFKTTTKNDFKELGGSINGILTKAGAAGPAVMAIASSLSAAAAGATSLLSAVGPAAAAGLAVYAGGLVAVKTGAMAVTFAMDGVSQAAAGDEKAMAKLSPEGKKLAKTLHDLQPEVEKVRSSVQKGLFPGVETATSMLAKDYLPMVDHAAVKTGNVLGGLAVHAAKVADAPSFRRDFGTILRGNASTMDSMGHAGISLADMAVRLFASAQPLIRVFFNWAEAEAKVLDKTVKVGERTGALAAFWDRAAVRGALFGSILGHLATAIGNVFSIGASGSQGGALLHTVDQLTAKFAAWTDSSSGAAKIGTWFAQGRTNLEAISRLVGAISTGFSDLGGGGQLAPLIDQLRTELLPPILDIMHTASVSGALNSLIDALASVATALSDVYQTDNGLKAFSETLKILADSAAWVAEHVPGAASAMSILFVAMGASKALSVVGLGGAVKLVGTALGGLTTKLLVAAGAQTTETGAVTAGTIARSIQNSTIVTWLGVKALEIGAWVRSGAAALVSGAQSAAAWLLASSSAEAGLLPMLIAFGAMVAGWVATAAGALAGAASVALAWLIAIAPIALVVAAVVGVVLLIIHYWSQIKSATSAAWNWVVNVVKAVPGKLLSFFMNFTLAGLVIGHFQQMKDGAITAAKALLNWVSGMPGRILTNLGNLGALLKDAGVAIIQGLLDGITKKFEDVKHKVGEITGWLKDHKGPKSVDLMLWRPAGNWIVQGLIHGLDDQMPALGRKVGDVTDSIAATDFSATASAAPPPGWDMPPASYPPGHPSAGAGDTFNIYETTSPEATAAEVSRRQAFAGAAG